MGAAGAGCGGLAGRGQSALWGGSTPGYFWQWNYVCRAPRRQGAASLHQRDTAPHGATREQGSQWGALRMPQAASRTAPRSRTPTAARRCTALHGVAAAHLPLAAAAPPPRRGRPTRLAPGWPSVHFDTTAIAVPTAPRSLMVDDSIRTARSQSDAEAPSRQRVQCASLAAPPHEWNDQHIDRTGPAAVQAVLEAPLLRGDATSGLARAQGLPGPPAASPTPVVAAQSVCPVPASRQAGEWTQLSGPREDLVDYRRAVPRRLKRLRPLVA